MATISEKMTAIANAIRTKTGETGTLNLDGMANALNNIPERGTNDLTASGATVTVPAGNYKTQASKTITSGTASSDITLTTTDHRKVVIGKNDVDDAGGHWYVENSDGQYRLCTAIPTSGYYEATGDIIGIPIPTQAETTFIPTTSRQTIISSGVYTTGNIAIEAIPTTTQATPSIDISSSGLITANAIQNEGYVVAGATKTTKQLTTKSAATIVPTKSTQTAVNSGVYTTGVITVGAIPEEYVHVDLLKKVPVLDSNYPQNATVTASPSGSVTLSIAIVEAGKPAVYTYQWYKNGTAISGANSLSYTMSTTASMVGSYNFYCVVTNEAGTVTSRVATVVVKSAIPNITHTAGSKLVKEDDYNWKFYCYGSGTLTISENCKVDVFAVGGGGGGATKTNEQFHGGCGGGGGYVNTVRNINVSAGSYQVTVGAGGSAGNRGGTSSALNVSASGGYGAYVTAAGSGGSGGGAKARWGVGGTGGSNGSNGNLPSNTNEAGIVGQGCGYSTREFGESSGTLYSGGGGAGGGDRSDSTRASGGSGGGGAGGAFNGGYHNGIAGTPNTGGGGGGGASGDGIGGSGGSGIIVIRNAR